jgi:hypothetical protein
MEGTSSKLPFNSGSSSCQINRALDNEGLYLKKKKLLGRFEFYHSEQFMIAVLSVEKPGEGGD